MKLLAINDDPKTKGHTALPLQTVLTGLESDGNHVPFLAVRTIADTPTHKGIENFERNCITASSISAEIVLEITLACSLACIENAGLMNESAKSD